MNEPADAQPMRIMKSWPKRWSESDALFNFGEEFPELALFAGRCAGVAGAGARGVQALTQYARCRLK
eukprot:scaffold312290_cov15-Tisochrysis_lutea.AAC.1